MKNSAILSLIIFSVVLLLALQGLWLTNSYEKAYFDLRREGSLIFKNTVFQLRDSIFASTLQSSIDSTFGFISKDSKKQLQLLRTQELSGDSLISRRKSATVQVFISSSGDNDSLVKKLGPISRGFQRINEEGNQNFMIRIAPDSLNIDSLTHYFQKNLQRSSINVIGKAYEVKFKHRYYSLSRFPLPPNEEHGRYDYHIGDHGRSIYRDTLETETSRLNTNKHYGAFLTGVRGIVLREIAPQVLFSIFLTLTIIAAFVFMYRNIRSQQRLMAQKSDFISNITHELKTPVATVSVALEALQSFDVNVHPERSKEYLAIAQQELNRLTELTDKILKTTVFEEQGSMIDQEIVDLDNATSSACSSLKLLLDKAEAEVKIERSGENFKVKGSTLHLTNSISNLLENSIKYSAGKVNISIKLHSSPSSVSISVRDQGIGIPQEYQKKIFEKFFRVPTGNIHKVKGYGLGLSYVANVIAAHKGKVEVKSNPGEGSEFIITIPKHSS